MAPRFVFLLAFVAGCYRASGPVGDVLSRDAGPVDGVSRLDALTTPDALLDGSLPRDAAGGAEGGVPTEPDGGVPSRPDAAAFDVGPRDASVADAPLDAAPLDAAPLDAAPLDAAPLDAAPLDAPFVRPDAPRSDAPLSDAPLDVPPFVATDAPAPTSLARRCRADSVMTMLDHPLFSSFDTTLELWIRVRGAGMIARKGDGARRHYELTVTESADGRLVLRAGWGTEAAERVVEAPIDGLLGRWAHVALVHRTDPAGGVTMELYVNAVLAGSGPVPGVLSDAFNTQAFLFCSFDGDLDEIRFWGGALDARLLEARRYGAIPADTPGLLAYWPLDSRGQVIFDRALSGADGVAGTVSTVEASDPASIADGAF